MDRKTILDLALIFVILLCVVVLIYFIYTVSTEGGQCVLNTYKYWTDHGGSCGPSAPVINWMENLTVTP